RDRKTEKYVAYAEDEDPEYRFVVLQPASDGNLRQQDLVPQEGGSLDSKVSHQVADHIYQGVMAHLRDDLHPRISLGDTLATYSSITVERRPNAFDEQMIFGRGPDGKRTAHIFLDPSLFQPGAETRLRGALFEAGGWLVHGPGMRQEEITARTWIALLRHVSLD